MLPPALNIPKWYLPFPPHDISVTIYPSPAMTMRMLQTLYYTTQLTSNDTF